MKQGDRISGVTIKDKNIFKKSLDIENQKIQDSEMLSA